MSWYELQHFVSNLCIFTIFKNEPQNDTPEISQVCKLCGFKLLKRFFLKRFSATAASVTANLANQMEYAAAERTSTHSVA